MPIEIGAPPPTHAAAVALRVKIVETSDSVADRGAGRPACLAAANADRPIRYSGCWTDAVGRRLKGGAEVFQIVIRRSAGRASIALAGTMTRGAAAVGASASRAGKRRAFPVEFADHLMSRLLGRSGAVARTSNVGRRVRERLA